MGGRSPTDCQGTKGQRIDVRHARSRAVLFDASKTQSIPAPTRICDLSQLIPIQCNHGRVNREVLPLYALFWQKAKSNSLACALLRSPPLMRSLLRSCALSCLKPCVQPRLAPAHTRTADPACVRFFDGKKLAELPMDTEHQRCGWSVGVAQHRAEIGIHKPPLPTFPLFLCLTWS
jgi:hypothetical protein